MVIPLKAEDDPTYLAVADLDADTLPDVALLHLERNVRGNDFHWKFTILLGDGAGNFRPGAVEDLGNGEFTKDHGPHYNTPSFQMAGAPGGKRLDLATLRDAVYMNAGLKWLSGGAVKSEGKGVKTTFGYQWGFSLLRRPGLRIPALADLGGRVLLGSFEWLGDTVLAQDDFSLNSRFLRADGSPGRIDRFGQAVALHDFNQDGLDDLALLSSERLPDRPEQDSRSIFVAYGDSGSPHPMSIATSSVPFVDRFKLLDNENGLWGIGSKAGTLLAGDFNGDSYPDLLTNTESGILVHPSFGLFRLENLEPEIRQNRGIHTGGNFAGQRITLQGIFIVQRFKVSSVFFTPVGAPQEKINLAGTLDPADQSFSFDVPPDNVVKPGDYILSVYNGTAESKQYHPTIKVKLRPIEHSSFRESPPPVGSSTFPVKIYGWFGNDAADQRKNKVTVIDPRTFTEKPATHRYSGLSVLEVDVPVHGRFQVQIIVRNPERGGDFSIAFPVDHRPRIEAVRWINPDRTLGHSKHVNPIPMQPGADVWVEGSMLLAPATETWRLLKGGAVVRSGTGTILSGGIQRDNERATLHFVLPTMKDETGLSLDLLTHRGLETNPLGPFAVKKGSTPPPAWKRYEYIVEAKSGQFCYPEAFNAPDDTTAESWMKLTYPEHQWLLTKLPTAEHGTNRCTWQWVYQILDSGGNDLGEEIVQTASRSIADVKIQNEVPTGGSAVFLRGPIK